MDIFFDEIFEYMGGFGLYQITMFILLGLGAMSCNEIINMNFVGYPMEHWCFVDELQNLPFKLQKDIAIPFQDGVYASCFYYKYNYSSFNTDDFFNWNRSVKIDEYQPEKTECTKWVYDRSVMQVNLVSEVGKTTYV